MSSRALRKLQREQEERRQLATLQNEHEEEAEDSDDGDNGVPVQAPKRNAFEFLNESQEDEEVEENNPTSNPPGDEEANSPAGNIIELKASGNHGQSKKSSKKKNKKKKKGGKGKEVPDTPNPPVNSTDENGLDEIDIALQSLNVKNGNSATGDQQHKPLDPMVKRLYELLAIDSKSLNALNEMKKLFGSAVLDGAGEEGDPAPGRGGRRRGRMQHLDLGAALAGRHSPASRGEGLAGLALRRNVFMPGKEEWPKAASGGLGMEVVERPSDGTTEYRFVHNTMYQGVQKQFEACVESMDPQRLIHHLQFNPYHISTILQVSEIAKHQGDHSVANDLLERALFSFGRTAHSSFHTSMAEGKARLDFRRPENREFWLAAYRYIGSLGQRGTWRTAYEWAKLLLSLDPEGDPYSVRLIIDQLAVRSGQFEQFINLASIPASAINWGQESPNVLISLGLAHYKLKHALESREILSEVVGRFPWIFARLLKELNVDHIPKSVWGREPRTELEEMMATLYVIRAKDIWNTPEALSLLVEVVETTGRKEPPPKESKDITEDEARHILLSEIPSALTLLPRSMIDQRFSASDPLPPPDNLASYSTKDIELDEDEEGTYATVTPPNPGALQYLMNSVLTRLGLSRNARESQNGEDGAPEEDDEEANEEADEEIAADVARFIEESGIDPEELVSQSERFSEYVSNRRRPEPGATQDDDDDEDDDDDNSSVSSTWSIPDSIDLPVISSQGPVENPRANSPAPYDDEANQRWLAGRGMLSLKAFIAANGSDEKAWGSNVNSLPAREYVRRIKLLHKRGSRNFILDYALKQGAGAEASNLIKRLLEPEF